MTDKVLAQVNIARMRAPLDDPVMAEFVNNLDRINNLAESSEGFIWRLKDGEDATSFQIYDDPTLILNMSVWENLDSLKEFTYRSDHREIFMKRKDWFVDLGRPGLAMWHVERGEFPTVSDAEERLDHLRDHGESPFAFTFKRPFESD